MPWFHDDDGDGGTESTHNSYLVTNPDVVKKTAEEVFYRWGYARMEKDDRCCEEGEKEVKFWLGAHQASEELKAAITAGMKEKYGYKDAHWETDEDGLFIVCIKNPR